MESVGSEFVSVPAEYMTINTMPKNRMELIHYQKPFNLNSLVIIIDAADAHYSGKRSAMNVLHTRSSSLV